MNPARSRLECLISVRLLHRLPLRFVRVDHVGPVAADRWTSCISTTPRSVCSNSPLTMIKQHDLSSSRHLLQVINAFRIVAFLNDLIRVEVVGSERAGANVIREARGVECVILLLATNIFNLLLSWVGLPVGCLLASDGVAVDFGPWLGPVSGRSKVVDRCGDGVGRHVLLVSMGEGV